MVSGLASLEESSARAGPGWAGGSCWLPASLTARPPLTAFTCRIFLLNCTGVVELLIDSEKVWTYTHNYCTDCARCTSTPDPTNARLLMTLPWWKGTPMLSFPSRPNAMHGGMQQLRCGYGDPPTRQLAGCGKYISAR